MWLSKEMVLWRCGFGGEVTKDVFYSSHWWRWFCDQWLSKEMVLWMWSLVDVVLVVRSSTRCFCGFSHWWRWFSTNG